MVKKGNITQGVESLWWLWVITAALMVLFGLATLLTPGITLATLLVFSSVFLITWGAIELGFGLSRINRRSGWLQAFIGFVTIVIGVYFARNPDVSLGAFAAILGIVFIVRGFGDAMVGTFVDIPGRALWWLSAVLSIAAGIIIWVYPGSGSLAFVWVLGLYVLLNGSITLGRAFAARSIYKQLSK